MSPLHAPIPPPPGRGSREKRSKARGAPSSRSRALPGGSAFTPARPTNPRGDGEKRKLCPTPGLREQVCDLNKDLVSKNIRGKKKNSIPPERSSTKRTCEQKHPAEIDCQFMHPQIARSSSWGNQGRNAGGGGGMSRGWRRRLGSWRSCARCLNPQPALLCAVRAPGCFSPTKPFPAPPSPEGKGDGKGRNCLLLPRNDWTPPLPRGEPERLVWGDQPCVVR